ncbi:hypothetical protein SAMN05444161_4508 [Rhizobiales bacterium GAS191]|nr:hypothetical protein SAMN05444161_4508 [Rhizobiales bacterium GAS191]
MIVRAIGCMNEADFHGAAGVSLAPGNAGASPALSTARPARRRKEGRPRRSRSQAVDALCHPDYRAIGCMIPDVEAQYGFGSRRRD